MSTTEPNNGYRYGNYIIVENDDGTAELLSADHQRIGHYSCTEAAEEVANEIA